MLCQRCQKRTANVHFTKIINGKKIEIYLCDQCANEKGHIGPGTVINIGSLLTGLINLGKAESHMAEQGSNYICEVCGMNFNDFMGTGKLGCSNCYKVFEEKMQPVLKRLHGSTEHTGKVPEELSESIVASKEIEKLRVMLAKAIQTEEYERAAEIRDRIKLMEGGG